VDQKIHLMIEDHNEGEFLAYYQNLFGLPGLPEAYRSVAEIFKLKALKYYFKMDEKQQVKYFSYYINLTNY